MPMHRSSYIDMRYWQVVRGRLLTPAIFLKTEVKVHTSHSAGLLNNIIPCALSKVQLRSLEEAQRNNSYSATPLSSCREMAYLKVISVKTYEL